MKIGLISCVSLKKEIKTEAKDLYISDLFKKSLIYCLNNYDKVYILSAKYGLLKLDDIIEPYNITLKNMNKKDRMMWSYKILIELQKYHNINDNFNIFYFYCGIFYREFLIKKIKNYIIPLKGLSIGKQLSFYKARI